MRSYLIFGMFSCIVVDMGMFAKATFGGAVKWCPDMGK